MMAIGWFFVCVASLLIAQLLSCEGVNEVPFTFVSDAVSKRAVCIDGSPAGYYQALGFGDGINNWIVYLMGGGWCTNYATCKRISHGDLGSTKQIKSMNFSGIFSSNQDVNPDFYNWNRVWVHYCDGSSFIGDNQVGPNLQFRGSIIFSTIVNELLNKGMKSANNALLAGGSAGGLATILNCDNFHLRFANSTRVKCLSDAGFFIRAKNIPFAGGREHRFKSIVGFHNLTNFLPNSCTSRMKSSLCLFPENLVEDIKAPLFLLNNAFDKKQIQSNLIPDRPRDVEGWKNCTNNLSMCTPPQRQLIMDFGKAFVETLTNIGDYQSRGMFINACYEHTYVETNEFWNSSGSPKIGNKTISQAVGDWYFDRSWSKLIDTNTHFPLICSAHKSL